MRSAGRIARVWLLAMALGSAAAARADVVTLSPTKDNTLYEDGAGALSNGAGEFFFAGRTNQATNFLRRGLIAFDIAAAIPSGSTVTSAQLTLTMSLTIAGAEPVTLHRVLADWGQGTSNSAVMGGGTGTAATAGDATWVHRFFNTTPWITAGGDFAPAASASRDVAHEGVYTWGSTGGIVTDVQTWLDDPGSNTGWVLIGNETSAPTAKRFNSRENAASASRPQLQIEFTPPDRPAIPTLSVWGATAFGALLLFAMIGRLHAARPRNSE